MMKRLVNILFPVTLIDICVSLRKYFFIYRIQCFLMKAYVFFCSVLGLVVFRVNFKKGISYESTLYFSMCSI